MGRTILVAGGSGAGRAVLSDILAREYELVTAADGGELTAALRRRARTISAIVLDLTDPGTDGQALLRQLRENAVYRQIPVVAAVERGDEKGQVKALALGAAGCVSRPYNRELLLHLLENLNTLRERAALVNAFRKDALTGLLNRPRFFEVAEEMVRDREAGYYTLACADIENFKVINDQYGVGAGDEVLRRIADTLHRAMLAFGGICCRHSADRFGVLYPAALRDSDEMRALHERVCALGPAGHGIRIRIGRYLVVDPDVPVSAMYDRATLAEESIRGRYDVSIAEYTDEMRARLLSEQRIVSDMHRALDEGEFEPWFQPQYNHATGALIGSEALVRWRKDGHIIPPNDFIPVFERNGFIYEVDQYLWRQVCVHLRRWLDEGRDPLPVSVNISRLDLFQKDFLSVVCGLVEEYRLPADLLRLEITESAFSESSKTIIRVVNELIRRGFTVEIDDFGSGYSSLNTLKDVPATILKLDMRFFENTENQQRGGNIIESVVRMAKWLGMAVIAEGVEDRQQADYLESIGCYYIQGFYYAKPMPAHEYEKLLGSAAKEPELTRLKTLKTLDNSEFWNPRSMETLIFNSYVGGACIFEYYNGKTELLRASEQYARELGGLAGEKPRLADSSLARFLDEEGREKLRNTIREAGERKREAGCEVRLSDGAHTEYVRVTLRRIAVAAERSLFYGVILNVTEQREAERRQMESARQLEVIMRNINGGVSAIRIDDDGSSHFVFNNERYYELYGYTREQAQAEHPDVMRTILPEDFPSVMEKVKKLKADGIPAIIDYRVTRRDGRLAYLRANASLMQMDGYGDVITSVVTDITEKRTLEKQLRAIVDNINGGVTATTVRNGKPVFVVVNDTFFRMLGFASREEFEAEGMEKYSGLHPDDRARVIEQFRTSDGGKQRYTMEYRVIRKDGALRYIRNNVSVIHLFGEDGPVQLSVANDITDLRLAQQKESETADKLSAVLGHAGNGITAIALREGKPEFLFANDKYFEIVGYTREAYRAATRGDMFAPVHPDDRETLRRQVTEANARGGSLTPEYRVIRGDGRTVWVRSAITVTRLAGVGAPVQIAVFSDITAERDANDQLRFLNDSAHDILAQPDSGAAVDRTLEKLLAYFSGDRAYVIELDEAAQTSSNTYERCAPGVTSELERLQDVPFAVSDYWFETLRRDEFVVIEDVDALGEDRAELRELLRAQNIRSILIAPLWRDGVLVGFTGVDNPKRAVSQLGRLRALADYIAILLTRRDLTRKIARDSEAMQTLPGELLDNLPCGAALYAYDGENLTTVHINRSYWQLIGREPGDGAAPSALDLVHPDEHALVYAELEAAIRRRRGAELKLRILCGDGAYRPFRVTANITPRTGGGHLLFTAYAPISDGAMSVQEMLPIALATMMSASEDFSYVKDCDQHYICCSRSVAGLLGLASEREIVGKTDADLFDAPLAEEFAARGMRVVETGEPLTGIAERIPLRGGGSRLVSTSIYPLLDASGGVIGLYGVSRDVTAQRQKESQLELLTSSIPGGLAAYAIDADGVRMLYFNDGFFKFSGCTREEYAKLAGADPMTFVFEEDKPKLRAMIAGFADHRTDGHVNGCIFRCHTKAGGCRWMNMRTVLSRLGDGQYIVNVIQLDVTEQQEERERLRVSEELNRLAIEHSGNIITRFDVRSRTLTLPNSLPAIFTLPHVLENVPEEQIALGRISPDTAELYRELFESIVRGKASGGATYKQNSTRGWRWLEAQFTTVFASTGEPVSAAISFTDVTEKLEKEVVYNKWKQSLDEREEGSYTLFRCNLSKNAAFDRREGTLLRVAFGDGGDGTFDGRTAEYARQYVCEEDREAYETFLRADALLAEYYRGHRSLALEYRERGEAGRPRWLRLTVDLVEYPSSKDVEAYLMYEDIDARKRADLLRLERAEKDPLTGILNRTAFVEKLEEILAASAEGEHHALLMLDIDNFKQVNDTLGHSAGDEILRELTERIGVVLRRGDLISRLGGDEFFVFLRGVPDAAAAAAKAQQICALRIPTPEEGPAITVSVGIAMIPRDGADFDTLYKKVDAALYRRKRHGKNGYLFVTA